MVSPAPVNPPGQVQTSATSRFFDTFGFHLLVVLLGIALAFM